MAYTYLRTFDIEHPELVAQWHPWLNGSLTPADLTAGSNEYVWWLCPLGHTWQARVKKRHQGRGCPVCAHRRSDPGVNDVTARAPWVARAWHPSRNLGRPASEVVPGSKLVRWFCCDPGHEYQMRVKDRARFFNCPACAARLPLGVVGLLTLNGWGSPWFTVGPVVFGPDALPPAKPLAVAAPHLLQEWHPTRNGPLTAADVTTASTEQVWWTRQTCGHEWQDTVANRAAGARCPACERIRIREQVVALGPEQAPPAPAGPRLRRGVNDLETVYPQVAAFWHPTRNGDLTPDQVGPGSTTVVDWTCPVRHTYPMAVADRVRRVGCPVCSGRRVVPGVNDLATLNPALAAQWHPTRNGDLTAQHVSLKSGKRPWWLCPDCGNEWKATIASRSNGAGCAACRRAARYGRPARRASA